VRRRWPTLAILVALVPGLSRADAVRTWGASPDAPSTTTAPQAPPVSSASPPEPPPATLGTPAPGSTSEAAEAPPAVEGDAGEEERETAPKKSGVTGLKYTLEGVQVRGNHTTLTSVVLRYVTLRAGDVLDVNGVDLELTRFRLLGTGFFRDVQLSLQRGSRRGNVILVVDVAERNTLVIDQIWLGLAADVDPSGAASRPLSAYGGAKATETNVAGTGIALGGAFAVADDQLGLRVRLLDPQTFRTNWITETELVYNDARAFFGNRDVLVDDPSASTNSSEAATDFAVAQYKRFGGRVSVGHDLGISSEIFFDYRLEKIDATLPPAASDNCGLDVCPIDFMLLPGSSILSTLGATFTYDTRDDPFLPTRGQQVIASVAASLTPFGSDYPYTKVVARGSQWFPLAWGHVLHLEAFAGVASGDAPLFERFYVGDLSDLLPDRALDLAFDRRAAPNFLGTDIVENQYGNYAAEVALEYRVPLYRGTRSIYGVDLFGRFGMYGLADDANFTQHPRGYSGLATVPVDLTFDAGLRIDTQAGGFVLGLANLVGLIPVRGQEQGAVGR
jgi:outer membrane protein insertion porin family